MVPFGDHALYVDPRDDKIALKLMAGRCWQRQELEAAIDALRRAGVFRAGGVFIDVGANIGALSIYALKSDLFSEGIAIEPDPHNFAILRRNLVLNGFEHQVRAVEAAASAAAGQLHLVRHSKNYGAHTVEQAFHSVRDDSICVQAFTLDDLLAQQAIDPDQVSLVKIDVEGHEISVLAGMRRLLDARVPILVELTAERGDAERLRGFKALLRPHYARVVDLSNGAEEAQAGRPLPDLTWRSSQADLLIY